MTLWRGHDDDLMKTAQVSVLYAPGASDAGYTYSSGP